VRRKLMEMGRKEERVFCGLCKKSGIVNQKKQFFTVKIHGRRFIGLQG
jgi:hypothetical protein